MFDLAPASTIAHTIQLSLAPVFLLTGVGAILAVLTNRLGRIIDRARVVQARLENTGPNECYQQELRILARRGRHIHWAIGLSTTCALLVCAVVALLFIDELARADFGRAVAGLFVAAMVSLCLALLSFLREIFLATQHVRIVP